MQGKTILSRVRQLTAGITHNSEPWASIFPGGVAVVAGASGHGRLFLAVFVGLDAHELPIPDEVRDAGRKLEEGDVAICERGCGPSGDGTAATAAEVRGPRGGRGARANPELLLFHHDAHGREALLQWNKPGPTGLVCGSPRVSASIW